MEVDDESSTPVCFICDEPLIEDVVKVTRGIQTFINVSKSRQDNHHVFLEKVSSVNVHERCRKRYSVMKNGKLEIGNKRFTKDETRRYDHLVSPKRKKKRESCPPFDFQANCFFCGLPASMEHKKKMRGRCEPFSIIWNPELQTEIDDAIKINLDVDGHKELLDRITLTNLVALSARYHKNCRRKFFDSCTGIPEDDKPDYIGYQHVCAQMDKITDHIQETDEEIYSLPDLIKVSGMFLIEKLANK